MVYKGMMKLWRTIYKVREHKREWWFYGQRNVACCNNKHNNRCGCHCTAQLPSFTCRRIPYPHRRNIHHRIPLMKAQQTTYKKAKQAVIFVIGATLILIGFAFSFLPGPGIVLVIGGLIIFAGEFIWAEKLLHKVRHKIENNSIGEKLKLHDRIERFHRAQ